MIPHDTDNGFAGPAALVAGPAGRLAVREQPGEGTPLVLVHGVNMNSMVWADVAGRLPGRRILALDLRGHGESDHTGPYSVEGWIDDVRAVLAHYGVSRAQFAGVSLGGMIVCLIAQQTPELVQSALAFGSALRGEHPDLERGMARLRDVGVAAYFSGASPLRDGGWLTEKLAEYAATPERMVPTVEAVTRAGFTADFSDLVRPSGRPVLVVSGEFDRTCTPESGRALASATGGEWELVPGAGHVIPVEAPELCAACITRLEAGSVE